MPARSKSSTPRPVRVLGLTRRQAERVAAGDFDDELQVVRETLAAGLRELRKQQGLTQTELAKRIGSSQPRIAAIEAAHPGTSLDLLVKCLFAAEATWPEVVELLGSAKERT